jgi:hypothetical protein
MTADEIKAKLGLLEMRQELLLGIIRKLIGTVEEVRDTVNQLLAWANEPPSSDLRDALAGLAGTISGLHEGIVGLGRRMPDLVAEGIRRAER